MKSFYAIHGLLSLVSACLALLIAGPRACLSALLGSFVVGLSTVGTQHAWTKILRKNSVAWPVTIIVLKYTLLAVVLYFAATSPMFEPLWVGFGLSLLIVTAVLFGLRKKNGSSF